MRRTAVTDDPYVGVSDRQSKDVLVGEEDDGAGGGEESTDREIQLISDGDGLAVIGEPTAVERFLRSAGHWAASKELDLRRLEPFLRLGSDVVQAASEAVADSGRWIKLTEESARLVQEHGLMETKTPGVSHVMVGSPGVVQNWLQAEQGLGSMLSNPAALSGVAGIMAQLASQQATAEIMDYLARIDVKVDDVLRKQDDDVVAHMIGAGFVIGEAMTVREATGTVNEVTWGKVEATSETIGNTQAYALLQLKAIAEKLEGTTRVGSLAETARRAETEVREWLAVLARCSELQGLLDMLEVDRVFAVSPDQLDQHRVGLQTARRNRLDLIAEYTEPLLDRIEAACGTANAKMLWNWANALAVVKSSNDVASGVHDFHELLGIADVPRSWEARRLERAAEIGAKAVQKTKDTAPTAAAAAALLVGGAVFKNKTQGEDPED